MATAITKRNAVNKEILKNKKILLTYKKDLLSIKKNLVTKKKDLVTQEKVCLHTQNKPTANSYGKFSRQIAAEKSRRK